MTQACAHNFAVTIEPGDIDFMGHVNNAIYLKWVQAAVLDHWNTCAPADARTQHVWVAVRHEITYRRPAFIHDKVTASVLLKRVHGARAFYETSIIRGSEILAEVKSSWCCLNAMTLRPERVSRDLICSFLRRASHLTERKISVPGPDRAGSTASRE